MINIKCILPILLYFLLVRGSERKSCNEKISCAECIAFDPKCSWCGDENYNDLANARCDLKENLQKTCTSIESPVSTVDILKNDKLTPPKTEPEKIVQIAPQHVKLKVRPGEPKTIKVKFQWAVDYPVDLYYIMDLSQSMNEHKLKLAALGDTLAETMSNITKNFRLGFGSFVDKVALPYVSTVPEKLLEPCTGCAAPYGFINHMPLSEETGKFKTEVNAAPLSGNLDSPEGGFDAIMQAIVCKKEIAWREKSRKLIVFSTDAGYHIAGDGKLAGIVTPNDEKCHLDNHNRYSASTLQDYPSVGQINKQIKEKIVHLIFAVTERPAHLYENLANRLEGSGVGKLNKDSRNVVDLVRDQYNKIRDRVDLRDNADNDIRVTYYSRCLSKTGEQQETKGCGDLKVGNVVEFDITIEVKRCPSDSEDRDEVNKRFTIAPIGLNESVTVDLEIICKCDCEKSGRREENSKKCSDNGIAACGICKCPAQRYGRFCECGATGSTASTSDKDSCIRPNSTLECSGVGQCVCGVCDCSMKGKRPQPLSGKFCECDDYSCPLHQNKLCGENGKCACGVCLCDYGWSGKACECNIRMDKCKAPGSQDICSNNGECNCGRCRCHTTNEGRFIGQFCEECPSCTRQCDTHWPCVVCRPHFQDKQREICQNFTCAVNVTLVDRVEDITENERFCVKNDDDNCKVTYKYGTGENGEYYIFAQKTKECSKPLNAVPIAAGVIAGVVAVGIILLLIWKLITMIHDRREYAKFENERKMAKWDKSENPIYKPSTSTFKNPTYNQ